MEKRVRQGQYEEALQYLHFAQQLTKKHQDIAVVQSIVGGKGAAIIRQLGSPECNEGVVGF